MAWTSVCRQRTEICTSCPKAVILCLSSRASLENKLKIEGIAISYHISLGRALMNYHHKKSYQITKMFQYQHISSLQTNISYPLLLLCINVILTTLTKPIQVSRHNVPGSHLLLLDGGRALLSGGHVGLGDKVVFVGAEVSLH